MPDGAFSATGHELRLTGARLRQLEASGHADAVAEWVRRRDDINKGCRDDINKQKVKLLSKLVIPPARRRSTAATGVKPAGKRGAASSAAAVPKKLRQAALQAKQMEELKEDGEEAKGRRRSLCDEKYTTQNLSLIHI